MASPSVSYSFSNGTTADATQVNQNFSDITGHLNDGTWDLNFLSLTIGGTATFNGNTSLGNASSDDVTITGSIASNVIPKTASTYNLGSSTIGWSGIYLGANSHTVKLANNGSAAADWTFTFPTTTGIAGQGLVNQGSGTMAWKYMTVDTSAKSADYTVTDTDGIRTILMTTASSDRTVTLPTAADNTGRIIAVKKVDSGTGTVIIDGEGAETIDGLTTFVLSIQNDILTIQCDGTGWQVIGQPVGSSLYISGTQGTITEDATLFNVCGPLTLTSGNWLVSGSCDYGGTTGNATSFQIFIDTANNTSNSNFGSPSSSTGKAAARKGSASATAVGSDSLSITPYPVTVPSGSTITLYLNGKIASTMTNATANGYIAALRIG